MSGVAGLSLGRFHRRRNARKRRIGMRLSRIVFFSSLFLTCADLLYDLSILLGSRKTYLRSRGRLRSIEISSLIRVYR
jgi:hypothetical protein